ncbi:unnamed protein product [Angiostrongylus costaricensis]|uniref:DUF2439 domain-containing protein n=1 Tax=Angiostrongylus costaricensis TaxID=334426 RepID=A0A0R3PSF3_ANGCS|nr:unnamed protein product [Angiostrongylus costaricensis]
MHTITYLCPYVTAFRRLVYLQKHEKRQYQKTAHVNGVFLKDHHLEIRHVDGMLLEKEESGIIKNDSLEEGELQESQATPLGYLPIKSVYKSKEDWAVLETTASELNSNVKGSMMSNSAQANSPNNVKKSDSLEDGEIREFAVRANDNMSPSVKNLKETPVVMKEERQSKRIPRKTIRFEPREEAVAPTKTRRSRCLVASVSASSKKQHLRNIEARPAKKS